MPKKSAATAPANGSAVATISPETLEKHPLALTRSAVSPIVSGEYTLDSLRSTFGVEGSESEVLFALARQGRAFFKQAEFFYSFNPKKGDLELPIDSDEAPIADASVYDPDGEGKPDYSDLVEEERQELAERTATPEPATPAPEPANYADIVAENEPAQPADLLTGGDEDEDADAEGDNVDEEDLLNF